MKQTISQWADDTLRQKTRRAIPIMTTPGVELCGKSLKEAVTNGNVHAEAIIKLSEQYPSDASTAIMDLTVEAEAMGAKVVFSENEIPNVVGRVVTDAESVEKLEIPSLQSGRIPEYLKANRLTVQAVANKPVFAGCTGPFTLAGRLFDLSEMLMTIYLDPDTTTALIEKCTDFIIDYCTAIKATGAQGVIMAEPAAGLITNDDCLMFSTPYIKKVVEAVQDETFIVILHNCGNTGHCTQAMVETGARGLHFGNKIDMLSALEACPDDVLVMGNLDPVSVIKQASAADVYAKASDLLKKTADHPNFILSTGCDVPPCAPLDNIDSFYRAVADYNSSLR